MRTEVLAIATGIFLAAGCAGAGQAQPLRNTAEAVTDNVEVAQDRAQRRDDLRDAARLEQMEARYEAARTRSDLQALSRLDREMQVLVAGELGEGRREEAQDRAEVRRDSREVRASRREVRQDRVDDSSPADVADDRRDLRDDRRDRRDDVRDARVEQRTEERRFRIAMEIQSMSGSLSQPDLARRGALLHELVALARAEVRQDNRELREDRRERREDRRERAEDRRD